jgi:uncharacterized protein (DUF927 family)
MTTPQKATLTMTDLQNLQVGYITPELAQAAGIYRVDSLEGARLVGQLSRKGVARRDCTGLVFPYRYVEDVRVREVRLRRDNPEQDTNGKEINKYLSPPGKGNLFYFAPSARKTWLSDATILVVFVEGEKKCLALQRSFDERGEQVLVIGLPGVWNWRGTVGKTTNGKGARISIKGAIPDFGLFEWVGREAEIIFDADAKGNESVCAARSALAKELIKRGAKARILEMPDLTETNCKGIDDLLGKQGAEFVADWLNQARQRATNAKKQKTSAGGVTFVADEAGVKATDADGNTTVVSSPLWIEAITRDEHAANFGRLLRFIDPDNNEKQWAMPASLLSSDKATYEGYLRDQGVEIFHSKHLHTYLASKSDKRVLVVSRTGWHRGVFVFTDQCIGSNDGEGIFHQSPEGGNHLMRTAGTLGEWRHEVARYCANNTRLTLVVCAGFAATLLGKLNVEGGGFHLRGGTSTGKTTALLVGGSVWGGGSDKGFLRRWRATINGLESVAASHNDALMCLDELAEVDAYQAGETAYMLANGQGKIRQTKSITLRKPLEWRTLFLSSGEISLADHLATVGKRARGGMGVRLIDLAADAGQGFGLFEELHGFTTAKELSDHLQEASKQYFGTAARAFIEYLVRQAEGDLRARWQLFKSAYLKMNVPAAAKEEAGRVCDRFALVALAGEMATEVGITGWSEGEATSAASQLFKEWLLANGSGRSDEEAAIQQVRKFIEDHQDSRFRRLGGDDVRTIHNVVGCVEKLSDGAIYYITKSSFQSEVCKGFDASTVAKALQAKGWLQANHGLQFKRRDPESGATKPFYAIASAIFEEE